MTGPSIIIHALEDARAALRATAGPVVLRSAPAAGGYGGVAWFERLIAAALSEFPQVKAIAILDCGDAPGHVMAAIRWLAQPDRVRLTLAFAGDDETARRLQDMAAQAGLDVIHEPAV